MTKLITILFVLLVIVGFLVYKFQGIPGIPQLTLPKQTVKGASTSIFSAQVQQTLDTLHQQVTQLSPKDISSSSPQIQTILKTLQQLPSGEAHDVCQKLCGSYLK